MALRIMDPIITLQAQQTLEFVNGGMGGHSLSVALPKRLLNYEK